jgi:hypothetical protein
VTTVSDREAVHDLLVGYFRGFDERRADAESLGAFFTEDTSVTFPAGDAVGLGEIERLRVRTLRLWAQTLHAVSSVQVDIADDRADAGATLLATHLHRPDDPSAPA